MRKSVIYTECLRQTRKMERNFARVGEKRNAYMDFERKPEL
jgi:hypothetical protein